MKEIIVELKGNDGWEYRQELIRCKDCINATEDEQNGVYECTYFWDTNLVLKNDYCSRAERKDD